MQLRFSVLARNRSFSKAMRRVRSKLQPLLDAFAATALEHPIHEAILVGITDDKGQEFFEEVENNDGFFGSSGSLVEGLDGWQEVEFPTKEQDSCAIVFEVAEATGVGLDGLDATVEAFAGGVGDVVLEVGQEVG